MSGQNATIVSPVPPPVRQATAGAALPSRGHVRDRSHEAECGGGLRTLEAAKVLLSVGVVAVAGSIALAVSVVIALLAVVVAGPFFLTAIVAVAFVLLGSMAFGATA